MKIGVKVEDVKVKFNEFSTHAMSKNLLHAIH